jgi:hypothetical protein
MEIIRPVGCGKTKPIRQEGIAGQVLRAEQQPGSLNIRGEPDKLLSIRLSSEVERKL